MDLPYILILIYDVPAWIEDGIKNPSYSHAPQLTVQTNFSHLLSQSSYTNASTENLCCKFVLFHLILLVYSGYCLVARNSTVSVSDHVTKGVAFIFFCVRLMAEAISSSGKLIE